MEPDGPAGSGSVTAALATDVMVLTATTEPTGVRVDQVAPPARTVPHPAGEFPKPTPDVRGPDDVLDGHSSGGHSGDMGSTPGHSSGDGWRDRVAYPAARISIRWHKMLYRLPCSPTSWETSSPDQTGAMQARGYGFLRTPLPHTLVNKGQLHTISCRVLVIDHVHRCLVELL